MPDENPLVNAWGDYGHYRRTKHWYLKAFVEPGNTLSMLHTDENRGWVDICEERDYVFEYVLEDLKGNQRTYRFTVRGARNDGLLAEEAERERARMASGARLMYDRPNVVQGPGMELRIPTGALMKDDVLRVRIEAQEDGVSNRYTLHDDFFPLAKRATLMLAPREPVRVRSSVTLNLRGDMWAARMPTAGIRRESGIWANAMLWPWIRWLRNASCFLR